MYFARFSKGPIQLYALPGTEDYVKKVARWIAKEYLLEIEQNNYDIINHFLMDEISPEEIDKLNGNKEEFLVNLIIGEFNYFAHRNGAIEISIKTSARTKDIYIFHTFSEADLIDHNDKKRHLNLSDQELLLYNTLDAFLEAKVNRVTIVEMDLGQARSDRPKGRGSCNLRTFFRNITANGADHFFVYQIHSYKSLIGLDNTRTTYDNIGGGKILKKHILNHHVKTMDYLKNTVQKNWVFSSVDAGGKEFAAKFSKSFSTPLLVVDKRRNPLTNAIEEVTILKPESLCLQDKVVFIVDDMIDSGGSIMDVCRKYKEQGVKEINVAAFYGIFSDPAEERLNQLKEEGALNRVIITDLITHDQDFLDRNPYIEIVDTSLETANVIKRTNEGRSLENFFLPLDVELFLTKHIG